MAGISLFIHSPFKKENPEYTFYTYYEGASQKWRISRISFLDIDLDILVG